MVSGTRLEAHGTKYRIHHGFTLVKYPSISDLSSETDETAQLLRAATVYITCTAHAPSSWWSISSHSGNHFCLFKLASFISHWFLQPYGSLNAFIKRKTHRPSHFESLDSHCTWVVLKCPVLIFNQLHMHNIPTLHVFTVVGNWTQGLAQARQVLYRWVRPSHSKLLKCQNQDFQCDGFSTPLQDRVLLGSSGWLWNHNPPASATSGFNKDESCSRISGKRLWQNKCLKLGIIWSWEGYPNHSQQYVFWVPIHTHGRQSPAQAFLQGL